MQPFAELARRIDEAWPPDRFGLRRLLRSAEQAAKTGKPADRSLARLEAELERSIALRATRRQNVPRVSYDDELPVSARRQEIADAIRDHQVVVVCGETGSGKSTQLPKICLELGRGVDGLIGHTQPRRIAARSVAARVAAELGAPLGQQVGFKVRFTDATGPQTYVKLLTDGMLLAETQHSRFLDQYDTIIIDEAHERSLNIDFLLGYLKQLLPKRRDLKLVITSATIDAQRFAEHFGDTRGPAPILMVEGRTYPVEVRYRPPVDEEAERDVDWKRGVLSAVDELAHDGRGHTLIFLPTERDIHELTRSLRGHVGDGVEVLPLYARLTGPEQDRVFRPTGKRRIVLATNVAESSLTVPGIHYVIDTGTARISRYSARSRTQRLPIEAVSQASADQRKGRCGRIGPGICIRLYSEEDYTGRERYTPPEIQRTNLASVILQTLALRLGPIEEFPFLDPPKTPAISDGYKTLFELGAIDDSRKLTELGRRLAQFPVDPRIGRMLLAADQFGCLAELLIIAAALEAQDPRERPHDKQQAADEAHAQFQDPESDFLSYLKLWDFYHHLREDLSRSKLERACRQNFLSYNRLREWLDLYLQLKQMVEQAGLKPGQRRGDYTAIHQSILSGLLSGVGLRTEENDYATAGSGRAHLWPGSGLRDKKPKWAVASEAIETTRRYLRIAARINPDWIEPLAAHLVNRSYSDPHWSRERGTVLAFEKVSLFGLPIVARRSVNFGPIDMPKSRELFLQHALVEGQFDTQAEFLAHNAGVVDEAEATQAKLRRGDLLFGSDAHYEFYDARVPADVFDARSFEGWWRNIRREQPAFLNMTLADVTLAADVSSKDFPDQAQVAGEKLSLEYRFEPGGERDGVTVTVPRGQLTRLDDAALGWLVPGLLEQRIAGMLKALPKDLRRQFVPVPDTARRLRSEIRWGEGAFNQQVADAIHRVYGVRLASGELHEQALPDFLRPTVRVVDERGQELAAGRDVRELRRELGAEHAAVVAAVEDPRFSRSGLTTWDFGELPREIQVRHRGAVVPAFPALVDEGKSAALALRENRERAEADTRRGVRRLAALNLHAKLRSQLEWLPDKHKLFLWGNGLPGPSLVDQLCDLLLARALPLDDGAPRSKEEFEARLKIAKHRISVAVQDVAEVATPLLSAYHEARLALEKTKLAQAQAALDDMRSQLEQLVKPGFWANTPWEWLRHYPRYLKAIVYRLDKLRSGGAARDRVGQQEIGPRWQRYLEATAMPEAGGIDQAALERYRWLLEELRVSLFAQPLGTSLKISAKRLDEQWAAVGEPSVSAGRPAAVAGR